MAEMSIAEFNQQQHDRYPDQIDYYLRIEQLREIIPRTQAQIAEDREIVRRAEFYDPNQQKPGNMIKLYVLTDKLPLLLVCKPNSTSEELAVAAEIWDRSLVALS